MADSVDQEISPSVSGVAGAVPDIAGTAPGETDAAEEENGSPETDAAFCSRYADIAVDLGYCARERIDAATRAFLETGVDSTGFSQYLVDESIVTREQARACERALRGRSSIGGFAILEKVGQGGMGTVFRARQISMDRIVAVKILAPKFAQDPAFKQRFLNEARTCAKLSHLNIINGIDCGEDSGYTYFAMEFVEGCTVKQVLKEKGRLEPDEAFGIIRQMAGALSYARKFDMVHRDIKPDNIMLTPAGVAKLCDLGLAMQSEQAEHNEAVPEPHANGTDAAKQPDDAAKKNGAEKNARTKSAGESPDAAAAPKEKKKNLALGTPHYMSPEQARGEQNIDARSDIYSLGATFYHLIVGETMFVGKTSTEVMMHHVADESPNPCVLDPEIPLGLGMIISKMMAKAPSDRYANADELIADLDAVKNGVVPTAAGFNAKSSCGILPPDELRRLRGGGRPRWQRIVPHAAAAVLLGVLAYFAAVAFGSKPPPGTEVATHIPPPGPATTNTPTTQQTQTTKVAETTHKPDDPKIKPETKSTNTTAKKPEKPPETPKNTVVKPPEPAKPVVVEPPPEPVVIPPPPPELPRPELKLTADILYARFLQECENRAGRVETAVLYAEMNDVALKSEYDLARDDVKAELADLKGALDFEIKTLKKAAEQKAEIEFPPDLAKKYESAKVKAIGYTETRGLQVELKNGMGIPFKPLQLPIECILAKAPDASVLTKVQYHYARGNKTSVFAMTPSLPAAEVKRWERKFLLLTTKESELTAREFYKLMAGIADAKSWETFTAMVNDFDKDYGNTPTAKSNLTQIKQWKESALRAKEPPSKWRTVFHAATVRDIASGKPNELPWVELTYDFKTPNQALDFSCIHGKLKVENGRMIVPEGGGEFAHVRLKWPFVAIKSFSATGRSLHQDLRPFGVVFVELSQALGGPAATNPMLKMDPATQFASVDNMAETHTTIIGQVPVFNWLRDSTFSFKTANKDKHWFVDDKPISVAKLPPHLSAAGGWIAMWGAQGNQSWGPITIVFRPDEEWDRKRKKADTPSPPTSPQPVVPVAPAPVPPAQ